MGLFQGGNNTCPLPKNEAELNLKADPVVGSLTFQHLILIISLACAGVVLALSLWLIFKHLHRYTEPKQQRQIIRIIFTPVVFSVFSVLSILFYSASIYLVPIRDLYEVFALASLFYLFVEYVTPNPQTRDAFFNNLENRKKQGGRFSKSKAYTVVPGGSLRWFWGIWIAVFGYVFTLIIVTIAEEISQAVGTYCATSLSPHFAHIWILIVQNVAVVVAVTRVLLLYGRLKGQPDFDVHKPLAKLVSFKLIVFVNFLQNLVFSILDSQGVLKGSHTITANDLAVGIPAILVSVEQVLFAIFFHYSFRSREYHESEKLAHNSAPRMGTFRAAAHAFNPYDLGYGVAHAFTLLFSLVGSKSSRRGSYQQTPVGLEPIRNDYPPAYGQGAGAHGLYQPQGQAYQSPYHSPNQSQSQGGYLGAGQNMMGYERSRSRSRSGGERELYQPPPSFELERQRLNPNGAGTFGQARSHSTEGRNAASMKSMV